MKIVIIGNGVAGVTCALTARQRSPEATITLVSGETDYFFSRTALMYAYMDQMRRRDLEPYERSAYEKQRIRLVRDWAVDLNHGKRELTLEKGEKLPFDRLVFAVGAKANMFPWDGADAIKDGLVHFVSMQDLDECERLTPTTDAAVVVGGGLIGIELVECLLHHRKKVHFLIREPFYWPVALGQEEATYVAEHMRHHGCDVRVNEEMTSIEVDKAGRVSAVQTNKGETLPCQMLGIAAGVRPNLDRIREFTDQPEMGRGIIVNERFETSLEGVYACGDCAEIHPADGKPYSELIWYSAKRHAKYTANNLFGDARTYAPPTFFNSSKFFDIEYTTVGDVIAAPTGAKTVYMKMPNKPVSVRIVESEGAVVGFNMLGSRWNHELLERWVRERRTTAWVEKNLAAAQYDVEFGRAKLSRMTRQELPLSKVD